MEETKVQITDLPEEVIVMIVRRLDFWSLCSMYNSCKFFQNLLSLHGVVLECNMSLSLVATANTMRLNFFKAISNHLLVLNMRGAPDLTKTKVLPAFNKLKRLKVLDISFTNLTLLDLMAIYNVCPTLQDITVDLTFGETIPSENRIQQYQNLFQNFENVHFVGSFGNLIHFHLVSKILIKSKLDILKYSAVKLGLPETILLSKNIRECGLPHFNHFVVHLINLRQTVTTEYPDFSMIELNKYDFFVISTLNVNYVSQPVATVYTTPIFKKFFNEHFNVNAECITDLNRKFTGNIVIMIWNRESTQFDDIFFHKLYKTVKPYFPFYYDALSDVSCPQNSDWILTSPRTSSETATVEDNAYWNKEKRRKTTIPNLTLLNYDNLLEDKVKAQLSLVFKYDKKIMLVSLPHNGQYLSKITFLSLSGHFVKYNMGFFSDLFKGCNNLLTLSVECPTFGRHTYSLQIVNAIKASQSIKNLRIVDRSMNFNRFFDSLSKCKTLENIYLVHQKSWDHSQIADPTLLIESCTKLFSICIESIFAETAQTKQLQWFDKVKTRLNRPHLRVVIDRDPNGTYRYLCDPFINVFKLSSIKLI